MLKFITEKNIFNSLLFIWCLSIPFKNAVYHLSTFFIVLCFIFHIVKYKDYSYMKNIILKLKDIFYIFVLIFISMTFSNTFNDMTGTDGWVLEFKFIGRYLILFFVLIYFYAKQFFDKKKLFYFLLIALLVQSFDGLYQAIIGTDFFGNNFGNLKSGLTGVTFNRNIFGFFMGLGVITTFSILVKNNKCNYKYFGYLFILGLFMFNMFFSYSRAVWISVFSSLLIYLFIMMINKKIKFKHILYILCFLGSLYFLITSIDSLNHRYESLLLGHSSHRIDIWLKTLELIENKPLLGYGIDSWNKFGLIKFAGIHNIFLEIFFFLGFIGLAIFLMLFFIIIKETIKNNYYICFISVIYFLIVGQFDHSLITGKTYTSSLIILLIFIFMNRVENLKLKENT